MIESTVCFSRCDLCGADAVFAIVGTRHHVRDDTTRCFPCWRRFERVRLRSLRNTFACKSGRGSCRRNGRIVARAARLWRV
jgi:hypothetical protein